jgi:hypothetical protein
VVGLGLGTACALYGLLALWTHHTFLPGLKGGASTVSGAHGAAAAAAYLAGGLFLICRFYVQVRCRSFAARRRVYRVQNLLLVALIAALVYVLWQVGTLG